jgi:hypothetical protein
VLIDHMLRVRVYIGQKADQTTRETLIEKQSHADAASRRSRSAANERAACTCASVNSGKSATMSSALIPPARYSSTSCTVMRVPRKHGLPLRTPGRTSISVMWSTADTLLELPQESAEVSNKTQALRGAGFPV